ncbi:MAG: histidinol dehydrogenase [Planctomycetales bacterium]|nr:histidinol dehydrogenase [Planctomycetales bacterium]
MISIQRIDARNADVTESLHELRQRLSPRGNVVSEASRQRTIDVFGEPLSPQQVVERICNEVQSQGLEAVLRYSRLLDGATMSGADLRVSPAELEEAHARVEPEFLKTVRAVRDQVFEFQSAILHEDREVVRANGVRLRQRYVPLRRAGLCVPGGAAAYPSTVLMTAVPAQAAGVEQLVVVAPPTEFGANNPHMLATCHELGIREVYRVGGAQAVAAMAYGVEGLPGVDKIVGPGNLFVALAKKRVYGEVDIDSIAGPSEVVVIADDSAQPAWIAADLLAQAEHAPGASVLVTWSERLLEQVAAEVNVQAARLSRAEWTIQSLQRYGALVLVKDAEQAREVTDLIAPEHLTIQCEEPRAMGESIRNAGATFIGAYATVALGDYVAGPSHVLPTGGTARWAAGLTANDFLRGGSFIEYTEQGLRDDAPHVQLLADREGLTAHRESVDVRLRTLDGG